MSAPRTGRINVISGHLTGDAALDTAVSRAILHRVGSGLLPETIQVGTPHNVVAFGKHDTLADHFPRAVSVAIDRGFDPTVRIAGGRAVVFHRGTVRFSWTTQASEPATTMHARFDQIANAVVDSLAALGVETTVGELPGEYCAGSYSVHIVGGGKIMGVGQRLTRSAAQVGGVIVVDDTESINAVLAPVYRALGVDMDPARTGCVADAVPAAPSVVAASLVDRLSSGRDVSETTLDDETIALASTYRADHVPTALA
ncbi:MAG: lipoate--protein ligase family protein [Actinomycetia bacterium]|nr:lipoate--protein ligase family protein [Actinomycetes bacterium]